MSGVNIGALTGSISIEDLASPKLTAVGSSLGQLDTKFTAISGKAEAFGASLGSMGSLLLAGGALGAFSQLTSTMIDLGTAAFNNADALVKMSDKTGIGIESLGRLQGVADASGNSIEQIAGGVNRFQKALGEGSKQTIETLSGLGLSIASLKTLRPEDQFASLGTAIAALPDPTTRAQLSMELLGRSGAELLPSLISDIKGIGDATKVMSDETARNLDAAGDAWKAFYRDATIWTGTFVAGFIQQNKELEKEARDMVERINDVDHLLERLPKAPASPVALIGAALPDLSTPSLEMLDFFNNRMKAIEKSSAAAMIPINAFNASVAALRGQLSGSDLLTKGREFEAVLTKIGGTSTLTNKELGGVIGSYVSIIDKYQRLGPAGASTLAHFRDLLAAVTPLPPVIAEAANDLHDLGTKVELQQPVLDIRMLTDSVEQLQRQGLFTEANLKKMGLTIGTLPQVARPAAESFRVLGQTSGEMFHDGLTNILHKLPDTFKQAFTGNGGIMGALKGTLVDFGSMVGNIIASQLMTALSTGVRGSNLSVGQVEGGGSGATGAAISGGSQIAGGAIAGQMVGTGASIGTAAATAGVTMGISLAVIGAIALYKAKHQAEWQKLGSDMGRDFGVVLSQEALKAMEADSKQFGRQATELLHLDEIIGGAGGLSTANLTGFTGKLHDVFSLYETGSLSAGQAVATLDKNWQAFAAAGTDADGRLSTGLKEILHLTEATGLKSKEIADYMSGQGANALTGFAAVVKGSALTTQLALTDMGVQAVASITAAVASGMSMSDALKAAGPALASLTTAYNALGLTIDDAALRSLLFASSINDANPDLMAAISGLSGEMIALDNLGLLNTQTFDAMERTGAAMYTRLQASAANLGGTTADALGPMQQFLHDAMRQAEMLGVPLDENTASMINQSKELGIWHKTGAEAASDLTTKMGSLVDKVGELIDRLGHIPDVDFSITGHYNAPTIAQPAVAGFATGTHGRLVDFGPRGTLVTLHNEERVQTKTEVMADSRSNVVSMALQREILATNRQLLDHFQNRFGTQLSRAMRDENQKASRR